MFQSFPCIHGIYGWCVQCNPTGGYGWGWNIQPTVLILTCRKCNLQFGHTYSQFPANEPFPPECGKCVRDAEAKQEAPK